MSFVPTDPAYTEKSELLDSLSNEERLASTSPTYAAMKEISQRAYAEKQTTNAPKKRRSIWGTLAGAMGGAEVGQQVFDARFKRDHANDATDAAEQDRFLRSREIDLGVEEAGKDRALRKEGLDTEKEQGAKKLSLLEEAQETERKHAEAQEELARLRLLQEDAHKRGDIELAKYLQKEELRVRAGMQASDQAHETSILGTRIKADVDAREDVQKFGTSEREATQDYQTGERTGEQSWRSGENRKDRRAGVIGSQGSADSVLLNAIEGNEVGTEPITGPTGSGYSDSKVHSIDEAIKEGIEIPPGEYARHPELKEKYDAANSIIKRYRAAGVYGFRNDPGAGAEQDSTLLKSLSDRAVRGYL